MSKAKFAAAKELIDEGRYDEARGILRTIDHPTAREWEAKLDKLEATPKRKRQPSAKPTKPKTAPKKSGNLAISNGVRGCLVFIVALVVLVILTPTPKTGSPNATSTSGPDVRPTNTEGQAAAIVPTNAESRSGFVTVTPAPGTVYPTATITDTPVPSATFTDAPTNTAQPTETPQLQLTPVTNSLYDAISTANARRCPDSKCDKIGQYQSGDVISVMGIVLGENYKGSPIWVQAIYHDGQTVYIHSSLVTPHVENAQPVQPVSPVVRPIVPANTSGCPDINATCSQLTTCEQARACLAAGNTDLDGDHKGNPCEDLCGPD